ncbi:UNVERIFIED_CONTAM: hypothetical protein Slati_3722100 [Sesamum latifolium]|uniref:Uncharacterized protein n=1 Tax=Sesamum latifolium TaxID=2727402 RepID=A0AAW2U2G4_9LAMI
MRRDLQDPFQKEFLQVKLFLLRKSSISASSCQQASSRSAIRLARGLASSQPAIWLASELAISHPASSCLATLPARGMLSSRPMSWLHCPSNGQPSLSFKAIQLLKELIPN